MLYIRYAQLHRSQLDINLNSIDQQSIDSVASTIAGNDCNIPSAWVINSGRKFQDLVPLHFAQFG